MTKAKRGSDCLENGDENGHQDAKVAKVGSNGENGAGEGNFEGDLRFTSLAMEKAAGLRQRIFELPFLQELVKGTLSKDIFKTYLIQDALYLREYSKVLALLAAKAPTPELTMQMASSANKCLIVEGSLHHKFLDSFGVTAEEAKEAEGSLACHAYISFLLSNGHGKAYEVAFASVLPCFTIYNEVGKWIKGKFPDGVDDSHPFKDWIETYGGEDFEKATNKTAEIADSFAEKASPAVRREMETAFLQAVRLEWMFWDSPYTGQSWPVSLDGTLASNAAAKVEEEVERTREGVRRFKEKGKKEVPTLE
eukprot:CAMPEP_0177692154 /NCGR_PEP_ID=MMETSP0484_2-20121128/1698_1 /TAXON_ID=354590 /ORGANISM="Rhodomonas lens, Strain RHODO" /LENGTH=307 /DNA_ID=CAMNT_0019202845 /DNA_START=30 /DNA_END=954 /DNA_ORIENTATION=-